MTARLLGLTAVAAAAAVLAVAGCTVGSEAPTPGSATAETSGSAAAASPTPPAPASGLVLPTVDAITTVASQLAAPSTVPPAPPAPDTSPAVFADPVSVARAWMAQWCAGDYREPRNHNIDRAAVYQTDAGKTADLQAGDTETGYRQVVEQRLTSRCDHITAEISPEAPIGPERVFVVLTAQRTLLAAERPFQVEPVHTTRAVLRQPDGRWLVDVHVEAG